MDIKLLKKYLKGQCNSSEAEKVREWISSDDFNEDLFLIIEKDLDQAITLNKGNYSNYDDLRVRLQEIYAKERAEKHDFTKKKYTYHYSFLKIAASILIILTSTFFIINYINDEKRSTDELPALAEKIVYKENDRGRKSTIFLPDGTVVYLNSASSIKYNEANFDSLRITYLTGEGFFEIAKDSIHPFKVITHNVEVTALGTSFNINSYREKDNTSIALVTGKVLIKNYTDSIMSVKELMLNPGQKINYIRKANSFSKISSFNPIATYGWKDGVLYFDSADLSTVLQKLERWFDVDFELLNKDPYPWRYTAQFHNQTLRSILESLSFSQNFKYKINGKKVMIEFNSG